MLRSLDNKSESSNLAIRAAWMSFVGGLTQSQIARRLNVSPAKVHRLIIQAREDGLVKVTIAGRPSQCLEIEQRLCELFELESCTVSPDLSGQNQGGSASIESVAHAAGSILNSLFADAKMTKIGVGMGRTLTAAVNEMVSVERTDLSIFSITGSLTTNLAANPYDIVLQLMSKTGGEGYLLPVPYLASSIDEKKLFLSQPGVRRLLEKSQNADAFLVGIGSLEQKGHLVVNGLLSQAESDELQGAGVVCDLMGHFINVEGDIVKAEIAQQAIGVQLDAIKDKRVFALAGGKSKALAVLAALRTGIISDLIVDEVLANALNDLIDEREVEDKREVEDRLIDAAE